MADTPTPLERMIYISRALSSPSPDLDLVLALAREYCNEVEAMVFAADDVLHVAELPFSREILRRPSSSRALSRRQLESSRFRLSSMVQQKFTENASRGHFHFIWRGMAEDLRYWPENQADKFSLIALGQATEDWHSRTLSPIRSLYVFYDDSPAAQRGLDYATRLASQFQLPVTALLPNGTHGDAASLQATKAQLRQSGLRFATTPIPAPDSMAALKMIIAQYTDGILFLPNNADLLSRAELGDFLTAVKIPVILVNPT